MQYWDSPISELAKMKSVELSQFWLLGGTQHIATVLPGFRVPGNMANHIQGITQGAQHSQSAVPGLVLSLGPTLSPACRTWGWPSAPHCKCELGVASDGGAHCQYHSRAASSWRHSEGWEHRCRWKWGQGCLDLWRNGWVSERVSRWLTDEWTGRLARWIKWGSRGDG